MNDERETRAAYRRELEHRINQRVAQTPQQGGNGNQPPRPPQRPHHHGDAFKWVRRVVLAIILLFLALGGYEYTKLHSTAEGIFATGDGKLDTKLRNGDPVSVLALGTDVGALDRGNKGGNTDTIELITINPKKEKITMTSIPRDTLVRVDTSEGADYVKINAAYSIGGAKQTVKQVEELLDVPVDYYAVINMGVLEKVVDAVGGVDVDNPFAFTYEGHHFKKGKQHLNGALALKYSRMRYDDPNNDYGRQKRQQQVMKSVVNTFKHKGSLSAANKILSAVKDGIKTDVPMDSIGGLFTNYRVAMNNVATYHFQGKNAMIDGASFQIASPREINRVSRLVRLQLGLKPKHVTNIETRMYNMQTNYDGYNNIDFILPNNATYNVPGSGTPSATTISTTTSSNNWLSTGNSMLKSSPTLGN